MCCRWQGESLPTKVVPFDNVLWYVLHSVLEEKSILVTEHGLLDTILESDGVYIVTERQVFLVKRYTVQLFSDDSL
jgi:hypothetical protein